jgi:hypothetical protein
MVMEGEDRPSPTPASAAGTGKMLVDPPMGLEDADVRIEEPNKEGSEPVRGKEGDKGTGDHDGGGAGRYWTS